MIELRIPARLIFRDLVLRSVATGCKAVILTGGDPPSREAVDAAVSMVGEAFNNVVEHAYAGQAGEVTIVVTPVAGGVEVELTDHGAPFDFAAVPPPDMAALPESGMGVFIIRSFADDVSYVAGPPNVLWMRKDLTG
ncbi:MAG: ATP-binding protein [Myxococcales bacterium]|nr:ATP-binding protein [Myxococcales bacterium]